MSAPEPDVKGATTPHLTEKETGGIDENGYASAAVTYRVPTISDAATYGPSVHELGIPEVSRNWTRLTGGLGYEVTINYKGQYEDEDDGAVGDYSMDISFSEEPIEKHPNLAKIMEEYAGSYDEEDKVVFEPELQGEGGGLAQGGGEDSRKNPMFGVKTYLALSGVFRHTYTSTRRPRLDVIGNIVGRVPGGFDTPEDHNWLVMPPKMRRQGRNAYQITQEYLLSQHGGWPESVYGLLGAGSNDGSDEDTPNWEHPLPDPIF